MSKPVIIQVIPTLGGGGAEREVARVSPLLNNLGPYQIVVCCVMGRGVFADGLEKAGVEVVVLNEKSRPTPLMFYDLVRFLKARKPMIAHSHLLRWGPTAAKAAGVPAAVMTEHGWNPPRGSFGIIFDRLNARFADKVVGVSEATKQIRNKKWGIPDGKLITIPNAVDIGDIPSRVDRVAKKAELGIPKDARVIGTIGRLIPIKAQKYFIEAVAEVVKVRPDCKVLVVGEGPLRNDLEQQAGILGIADNVIFTGFRTDAREITCIMDVACLSSVSEGTPITMLEAMACGKPCVVTDVGGCPEVVADGVTGFVVPPRDPHAMAHAILKILNNAELAEKMGQAGLERVNTEYSVDRNLTRLLELYSSLERSV